MSWPLFRLAHIPELLLRHKLYLDLSSGLRPRFSVPEFVEVPQERSDGSGLRTLP